MAGHDGARTDPLSAAVKRQSCGGRGRHRPPVLDAGVFPNREDYLRGVMVDGG